MTAYWQTCDVFDGLAQLESGSIDLVVTSPPFLALRSYLPADHPDKGKEIGSEATPAAFLDVMLRFTAELRRVVALHGSICIELGDTYSGGDGAFQQFKDAPQDEIAAGKHLVQYGDHPMGAIRNMNNKIQGAGPGWPKSKCKTLIPELYRIALAYGINPLTGTESPAGRWRVRNVVTWCRPNPPVGALGDKWRPATSDVVVACTSDKRFWDDLATRKPFLHAEQNDRNGQRGYPTSGLKGPNLDRGDLGAGNFHSTHAGAPLLDYWEIPLLDDEEPRPYGPKAPAYRVEKGRLDGDKRSAKTDGGWNTLGNWDPSESAGAPMLDYWVIPPTGYAGAHYAVYPQELVVPLVKAMGPQRVCRVCGEPSRRIVIDIPQTDGNGHHTEIPGKQTPKTIRTTGLSIDGGWSDCGHDNYRPGIVLDPFAGSGTTLAVAQGHGLDAIGMDLDPRNEELARERVGPMFFQPWKESV